MSVAQASKRRLKHSIEPRGGPVGAAATAAAAARMKAPGDVAEEWALSPFTFSRGFQKRARVREVGTRTRRDLQRLATLQPRALEYAAGHAGGPTVGVNRIKIWIDGRHARAGSEANYIWMHFGRDRRVRLWGHRRTRFPRGWWLEWDLGEQIPEYLETVPTDAWDEIALVNPSGDGIKIRRILISHSSVNILDWTCNQWLDGSKLEAHGTLGLAAPILAHKLALVGDTWMPQIHWAARELGKTDSRKYSTPDAWCSEFATWCLRRGFIDTPPGDAHCPHNPPPHDTSICSKCLEDWFSARGRKYTQAQLLDGTYELKQGDYLRFRWAKGGHHSGIFIRYLNGRRSPRSRVQTIEGNTQATVKVKTRTLSQIRSVGNTR